MQFMQTYNELVAKTASMMAFFAFADRDAVQQIGLNENIRMLNDGFPNSFLRRQLVIKFNLIPALVLAAAVAAPAVAKEKATFTHEGVTYVYSETKLGASTIYKGRATPGDSFYLVARNGQVTGTANSIPVSFRVPEATVTKSGGEVLVANR